MIKHIKPEFNEFNEFYILYDVSEYNVSFKLFVPSWTEDKVPLFGDYLTNFYHAGHSACPTW